MLRTNQMHQRHPPSKVFHYDILYKIGDGGFSQVYRAIHLETGIDVAIKAITKIATSVERVSNEVEVMKRLDHPNAPILFDFFEDGDYFYIVTELINSVNDEDSDFFLSGVSEEMCKGYFKQVLSVLKYLHQEVKVLHRDIKEDNVLIDSDGNVKLIDYGLSDFMAESEERLRVACGSPAYAPPEMYQGGVYTEKSDIWGLGVLLYVWLSGHTPWYHHNSTEMAMRIIRVDPEFPAYMSYGAIDLLQRMLSKSPLDRPSLDEIEQHPWCKCALLMPIRTQKLNNELVKQKLTSAGMDPLKVISKIKAGCFDRESVIGRILVYGQKSLTLPSSFSTPMPDIPAQPSFHERRDPWVSVLKKEVKKRGFRTNPKIKRSNAISGLSCARHSFPFDKKRIHIVVPSH